MRPRVLNLAAPSSEDTYELLLNVKSKIGVLHEITGFLAKSKIDILSMHIQAARGKTAVIVAYLEMEESKTNVQKLLRDLRDLDFVIEAEAVKKDGLMFEEFLFPILVDDEVRGFLMTDSAWMSIASRMVLTYGTGGLAILYEAGLACGEEYARHLHAKLGLNASAKAAIENLGAMLRAVGMGVTEMNATTDGFLVKVTQPVIPATETKFHDRFLAGLIAGAAGRLMATSYSVENVKFEGDELSFKLSQRAPENRTNEARARGPESSIKSVRVP